MKVSLLTAGKDKPYVLGLLSGLISAGVHVDFIGNDEMQNVDVVRHANVSYLNLRGDQSPNAPILKKVRRILRYYFKLIKYAPETDSELFHIQWLNKFIYFDRTVLNIYYKLLGKRLVYTAHNINMRERDGNDTWLNRMTLQFMYTIVDHVIVHTRKMQEQLIKEFAVNEDKVTVIPFGTNNTVPNTELSRKLARNRLSLKDHEKVILFFGNIAPYKGLDYLVLALPYLKDKHPDLKLVIAGRIKECEDYWNKIQALINEHGLNDFIIARTSYIPDKDTEVYFKSADVLVLPYRFIFQSGPLFLSYNFGLPVIVTNVGSFREDIIEGKTGFICRPEDPIDLADKIDAYFKSDLYNDLQHTRINIAAYARDKYSWEKIGRKTCALYQRLTGSGLHC